MCTNTGHDAYPIAITKLINILSIRQRHTQVHLIHDDLTIDKLDYVGQDNSSA